MLTPVIQKNILARASLLGALVLVSSFAQAELPTTKPEKVGMSTERLQRINEMMQRHIDAGDITGGVTAVARRGQVVHFQAHGLMDLDAKKPMPKDAVFRMASSTKPIAGVAVMMLVEEGKIRLTDPVHKFIPEFKDMKVAVPKHGGPEPVGPFGPHRPKPVVDLVSANRDITIRDLLTHTSGLLSGGLGQAVSTVERKPGDTLATYIPRLGSVPLDFQPGTRWRYSAGAGIDTLGRIVEIASGMSFDQYLSERIFKPLGMKDTYFNLPEDRQARLLPLYRKNGGKWEKAPTPQFLTSRVYFSGAGGLMSTAHDYLQFQQMFVNRGQLNGVRLLSPKTVELMAMNHVKDLYRGGLRGDDDGMGFGLTMAVHVNEALTNARRSTGAYGWAGAFGTMTWTDPEEGLACVLMIQQPDSSVQRDFQNAVLQAIVD
jgi:CubicO group peptidase (beta-lactamase class C family)